MRRVPFVAILAFLASAFAGAQVGPPAPQGGRPGVPGPGAQAPGLPPRDSASRAPQTGTGKLRGRVLASPSGDALRRAQIVLTSAETGASTFRRVTTTDAEGRFELSELPAGRFSVSATKAGYVTLQFGQRRPFETGTPVSVADGQTVERIDFALPRGSVIVVRVTDEFGEPVAGVAVQVQRYQYGPDGQRRLSSVPGPSPFPTTDDQGQFRAFGLMPGEYLVHATMRSLGPATAGGGSDSNEGFSPTFYPGTISAEQAQAISLSVGEEQAIQFPMVASRMGRVAGAVVDSEQRPAAGASIMLVTVSGSSMSSSSVGTTAPDGTFAVNGIPPGEHTLRVTYRSGAAGEFGAAPIVVGATDITGLQIALGAGTTISGRVTFEGTSPRTGGITTPRVAAQQVDPQRQLAFIGGVTDPLANGSLDDEGNFKLAGASGRVFFNLVPALPAWVIKSVTLGGDDITDVPIDLTGRTALSDVHIVLTDKQAGVSGQVTNERGQLLTDYVVVIQGAEQREPVIASRAIRVARPDTNGRFETRGIRPGRYVATAIEALEQGRQFAPEFQQQLRRSAREFTVREGETVTVDLRLTPDL